jgi:hypothetical protein
LGIHCREKGGYPKPLQVPQATVATLPHRLYSQLIHRIGAKTTEQLVGELWIVREKSCESRMVVNYRLFISIWIFRINSLDNFMFKQDSLPTTLKTEKYF